MVTSAMFFPPIRAARSAITSSATSLSSSGSKMGAVATAIGEAGGDIEAIEIVEKSRDGWAVDDVILALADGTMPDSIVSACTDLENVDVLWISRYAGGQLFLDLEVVEALTDDPSQAVERLADLCLDAFRAEWAAVVDANSTQHATPGAPSSVPLDSSAGARRSAGTEVGPALGVGVGVLPPVAVPPPSRLPASDDADGTGAAPGSPPPTSRATTRTATTTRPTTCRRRRSR